MAEENKYPDIGLDFQEDLAIDKNRLDEELMRQAAKMAVYNRFHAQEQYNRDRVKQNLDLVKANLDSIFRAELTAAQVKFTEAVIDGKVKTSPAYLEAQGAFQKAEYKVNVLFGGVLAMNARKGMLESLVRLVISDWYSEPRVVGGEGMKANAANQATEDAALRAAAAFPPASATPVPAIPPRPTPRVPPKA